MPKKKQKMNLYYKTHLIFQLSGGLMTSVTRQELSISPNIWGFVPPY
jgi:hypothetical protein